MSGFGTERTTGSDGVRLLVTPRDTFRQYRIPRLHPIMSEHHGRRQLLASLAQSELISLKNERPALKPNNTTVDMGIECRDG